MSGCGFFFFFFVPPCKSAESPEVTLLWAVPWEQGSVQESLRGQQPGPRKGRSCPGLAPAEPGEPCGWLRAPLGRGAGTGVGGQDVSVFSGPLQGAVALKVPENPTGELARPWQGSLESR